MNIRIVLAGPESTGKSALTRYLADTLQVPSAQEYARAYLEQHGPAYDYGLLLTLSRSHKMYQAAHVPPASPVGILDTDLINYKIWCDVVFGKCHEEIISRMSGETSHVYLLCYPDLPWEYDPIRENRDSRDMLFDRHVKEIERLGRPYSVIRGLGDERRAAALAAAQSFISSGHGTKASGQIRRI